MWNTRFMLRNKCGFTLMELICVLCIGSIIIGVCFSMLIISQKSNSFAEDTDELLYSGNFAIEYIKNEIQNADKIIATDKIKDLNELYPNNIGIVGMEYQPDYTTSKNKYVYFTYYIENNSLFRLARRFEGEMPLVGMALTESNELCGYLKSFEDTTVDWDNKILYLDLKFCDKNIANTFKSTVLLSCPLDY